MYPLSVSANGFDARVPSIDPPASAEADPCLFGSIFEFYGISHDNASKVSFFRSKTELK